MVFPNDPRLAARRQQQQQATAIENEASRKRNASQSPATDDRHAQKLAKPGTNSSRQQSTASMDPRKPRVSASPASSRRPSMQTNGGSSTPRAAASPVIQQLSTMDGGANLATGLSSKQNEALSALITANNFAAELASTRMFHGQAKAKKEKADREYSILQNRFVAFPSMKEQHTNAKRLADEGFKIWADKLRRQEDAQRPIMSNLVKLFVPSTEAGALSVDYISRAECDERVSEAIAETQKLILEKDAEFNKLNDRIAVLEGRLKTLPNPAPAAAPDDALTARVDALQGAIAAIEGNPDQQQVTTLVSRIDTLQQTVATMEAKHSEQLGIGLAARVDTLEGAMRAVEDQIGQQPDTGLEGRIDTLHKAVKDVESNQAQQDQIIETYLEDKVKASVKSLSSGLDQVHEFAAGNHAALEAEINDLRGSFSDGNKIQHQNALAINSYASRLEHIEQQRYATHADLEAMEKNVAELSATSNPSNLNADGLFEFRPVPSDNVEEDHLPRLMRLENDVKALQAISGQHKQRLDNTTTDHFTAAVVNQVCEQFPFAKEFHGTVQNINNHLSNVNSQFGTVNANVNAISGRVRQLENSTMAEEVGNNRMDIAAINSRVAKHENIVAAGQKEIEQINGDIKAIKSDVVRLDTAFDKAIEGIPNKADG